MVAAVPPPRIAHAQAVVQDRYVYIFGGRAGITMQEQALNDLWRLDTKDWSWTQINSTQARPPARSFHRMVAVDDKFLFVFGGCGAQGRLNDLWKFDCTHARVARAGIVAAVARAGRSQSAVSRHPTAAPNASP